MLQLLQTGQALYVLSAICILGLVSKFITRNSYKRLIKETNNMTLTKNKYLRTLKQTTETTYRMNHGISNPQVYLEKQLYGFHFMGMTLNGWTNFSNQIMLLCFMFGGVGAFASYWYRCDSYYIVLYGSTGILTGLLCFIADSGFNLSEKRMQLLASLQDYLENVLFSRLGSDPTEYEAEEVLVQEASRSGTRENARVPRRVNGRVSRRETAVEAPPDHNHRRDIDYLKKSLEQIAASREKNRVDDKWMKDLKPDEVKLIGEILHEYLS